MSYNPYVQQGYYQQPQQPQQQTRPNIALKKSFGSGLYLFVAILNTLVLALAIVNIFMPLASIQLIIQQYASELAQFGISQSEINEVMGMLAGYSWIFQLTNITACIIPFLTTLAMWLIWGNSKKEQLPVGTAGFTILKILIILNLISICLIGVLVLIMMIPAIVGGSALDQYLDIGVSATVLVILLFVIMIAAIVLIIIYYAKLLGIYSAAKDVGRLGVTAGKVSMFVIVINFIGLIFQLVGVAGSILTFNFMSIGSSFLALLSTLFVTIVFIKFRNALEEQKAATPAVTQQPMNNPYQPYQSPQQQYGYQQPQQSQYAHPYPAPQQPYGYPQQGQYQQRTYQQQQAYQQYNNYNAQMQAQQQLQQQGQRQAQQAYQQTFQPQQSYQQQSFQPQAQAFQAQAESFQSAAQSFQPAAAEVEQAAAETAQAAQGFAAETVTPSDVIDE